jgi:hypothetical protein
MQITDRLLQLQADEEEEEAAAVHWFRVQFFRVWGLGFMLRVFQGL